MKKLFLTIILLFAFAVPGWATTYTVCSSGCDETTVQAVFDNNDLAPGDIIDITDSGTYREMVIWGSNDVGDGDNQVILKSTGGATISGADILTGFTLATSELHTSANAASDPNGNEANATTGWSVSNATIASSDVQVDTGSYSLLVTDNGSSAVAYFTASVTSGRTYALTFKSYAPSSNTSNNPRTFIGTQVLGNTILNNSYTPSQDIWESRSHTNISCTEDDIWYIQVLPPQTTGDKHYIDNLSFMETSATAYEKGSVATEPRVVSYDNSLLTENNGETVNVGSNEWDWDSNTLYVNVGEDPDTGTLEAGQRDYVVCDNGGSIGYITIQNLTVQMANKSWGGAIDFRGDGGPITVQSNTITRTNSIGIMMLNDNSTIDSNDVSYAEEGEGIHIHENCSGTTISRNTLTYNYSGAEIRGDSNTFEKNLIHHNNNQGLLLEGRASEEVSADSNIIRYNNIYTNAQNQSQAGQGGEIYNMGGDNNKFYGNLIHDGCQTGNGGVGIWFDFGGANNLVYNNVIYNFLSTTLGYGIHLEDDLEDSGESHDNIFKNNIIEDCRVLLALADDHQTLQGNVFDYNDYYIGNGTYCVYDGRTGEQNYKTLAQWQASTGSPDANSISSDPAMTDPSNGDFTLQSSSLCIDAGTNLGATYDDALDTSSSWPSSVTTQDQDLHGNDWEIGAYVYETIWRWGD